MIKSNQKDHETKNLLNEAIETIVKDMDNLFG